MLYQEQPLSSITLIDNSQVESLDSNPWILMRAFPFATRVSYPAHVQTKLAVQEAWDSCFNDTTPFEKIP